MADGDEAGIAAARAEAANGEPVRIPVSGTLDDKLHRLAPTGRVKLALLSFKPAEAPRQTSE